MKGLKINNLLILKIFSCLLLCLLLSNKLYASQLPRYLGSEKKFRSYIYNPNEVYRYLGHYVFQGFIEFEKGENVSTITMGDPSQWLFEYLGNKLFLKPVGEGNSQTNMTVITNKRIYHFELTAKEAKGIDDKDLIFVAKFVYPDQKDKNILKFPKAITSDIPDLTNLNVYNFDYQYTGSPSIAPIKVFDNGEFTYFQFPRINAEIPAIFDVDSSGFESIVNYRVAGEYIIVEKVSAQFTLRNGEDIVCVYNSALFANSGGSRSLGGPGGAQVPRSFSAPIANQNTPNSPALNFTTPSMPRSPLSPTPPMMPGGPGPALNIPRPPGSM